MSNNTKTIISIISAITSVCLLVAVLWLKKTVDTPPSQFDAGITMVTPETKTISILEEEKRCDEAGGEFYISPQKNWKWEIGCVKRTPEEEIFVHYIERTP